MDLYRVTDTGFVLSAGVIVGLDQRQFARRAHRVEHVRADGETQIVRTKEPLEFKKGETLALEALSRRHEKVAVKIEERPATGADDAGDDPVANAPADPDDPLADVMAAAAAKKAAKARR